MKQEMINNARAFNKHLTKDFLERKTFFALLSFTHPLERMDFIKRYNLGEDF